MPSKTLISSKKLFHKKSLWTILTRLFTILLFILWKCQINHDLMHLRKADVLFAHILLYDILMKYNEYFVKNDSYRIFTKLSEWCNPIYLCTSDPTYYQSSLWKFI